MTDECPGDEKARSNLWTLSPIVSSDERVSYRGDYKFDNGSKNWKWVGNLIEQFDDASAMYKGKRSKLIQTPKYYQGASGVVAGNYVLVQRSKSRMIDRFSVGETYPKILETNGIGNSGFRRPSYHYANSATYLDFEIECPSNCSSPRNCTLFTIWTGKSLKGELAISQVNPMTLRHEKGSSQTIPTPRSSYQECFIAKKVLNQ